MALGIEQLSPFLEDVKRLQMNCHRCLLLLENDKNGPRVKNQRLAVEDIQAAIANFEKNELHIFRKSLE